MKLINNHNNEKERKTMRKVNIQALVDFADGKKRVDPWALTEAAESFYRSIKVMGLKNTTVFFKNGSERIECSGAETSVYVRAFTGHVMRLIHRWSDIEGGRLEAHLGLDVPIQILLSDVFIRSGADLRCTNVAELIDTWVA